MSEDDTPEDAPDGTHDDTQDDTSGGSPASKPDNDPIGAAIAGLRRQAEDRPRGDGGPPGVRLTVDNEIEGQRRLEALLFAAEEPLDLETLQTRLGGGFDVGALLTGLQAKYAGAGVNLVEVAGKWRFQTAEDLQHLLQFRREEPRKLSQAALETLSIIAYHQPVTRAEIEDIRGVAVSKGTVDLLFEQKWVRLRGRRRSPGRPVTYGTTDTFLEYFGLPSLGDLPGVSDLKAAGLLSSRLPPNFDMPDPGRIAALEEDLFEDDADAANFHVDFLDEDDTPEA
ncbi:SMC-Scp complex subunit ScpB [Marinicauda pacifica]|jgi:segregation and condensation protein B|uniref:SMC-Scp complex subunit ScpB n=1 Tax=Marinicauda pacifica TaxID=1133559 RepID=UPI0035C8200C